MKKIKQIRFEDEVVEVEWDKKDLPRMPGGYPQGGEYKNNTIKLSAYLRKSVIREWVLHEALHKVWEQAGLRDRYAATTEEYILSSLDGRICDLLRDNPDLVKLLVED